MTYAQAGVDINAGDQLVEQIKKHTRRTVTPRVLGDLGGFAGCFRLDYNQQLFKRNYRDPVLVSCTDGVGTKVKLAAELGIYDTVGIDLVAMSVNDLVVQGAEPLFFLDYLAIHKLIPDVAEQIVKGVCQGCLEAGCALLGGETAEMPDVYSPDDFDLAGFAVGVCELKKIVSGSKAMAGDVILGLGSSGIHSNGYSLVRAIVNKKKLDLHKSYRGLGTDQPLGRVLLTPTRIYAKPVVSILNRYQVKQPITAMAHITGGGLPGNLPRVLGKHLNAKISKKSWDQPAIYTFLQQKGRVADDEMLRVFNLGIGYILVVRPHFAGSVKNQLEQLGEKVFTLGKITPGTGRVSLG